MSDIETVGYSNSCYQNDLCLEHYHLSRSVASSSVNDALLDPDRTWSPDGGKSFKLLAAWHAEKQDLAMVIHGPWRLPEETLRS